jgi:PAS domain S-box-containing protein
MAQMYGYEKAADLIGVRLSQFFPDDADARAYFKYFIESGYRVQEAESRELDRHGEARYFINNLVGIIEDKKLQRAWGTQRDITNQKLAEDRLHKAHHEAEMQRRLYEAVTNSTPDLIYVFNLNYRFTYANKALLEMWGRNWEEAIGKGLRELGYEEWHAQLHEREIDEIAATKKTIRGTVSFPHATLGKRIYDYILSPVLNDQGEVEAVSGVTRDISDIKKVEEALLESEHRFRNLADSAPVMIWMTDETGHCFYLNKQWYDFTGQTIEEGHGMGWTNAVHPDERQKAGDIFMKASEACLPYRIEFRLRRHDGSYHWVIDSAEPRIDENGRFLGFIGSVVDIHYRKEAEEELRHLSYHLKLATESAGVGTWSFDTQTSRLEWSELHKEMWGYGKDSSDLTYQDWYKVIVPEDFEESLERVEYARIHRLNYENEYRIRRAGDGVIRWMRSFGQFLYNEAGEAYKLTGITVDITLQKEAEEALMESEERFRNLADNAPMWVWLSDENANVTYVNKEELAFFGLTKVEDFTAKAWEQSIHPDDLPLLYEVYSHAVQHRQPYTLEARLRNVATGQYEWFHFRGVPRTEHGEFKGIIGTANNIQQQRMLTEHLEALVAERTQELKRSNEDLQQFAHVASHDLKEPVRKIRTFLSRLEMEFGEQLPQRGRTYMEKIAHSARRMTDMIDGVLQFSSVSVHEQKPDLIDLNEVMQDIEGDLEILIHQKKALLSYEALPVIMGSPVLIHQLFYNLVNNSLKFSKDDVPVSVHVYCRSGNDASIRPGYTEVVIEDNGIGFSQKHAQRIFQTFTRLNSKDEYEGTGLGLALCQKIVERHGGTIRAEGEEGKGARFVITLPTNT